MRLYGNVYKTYVIAVLLCVTFVIKRMNFADVTNGGLCGGTVCDTEFTAQNYGPLVYV